MANVIGPSLNTAEAPLRYMLSARKQQRPKATGKRLFS